MHIIINGQGSYFFLYCQKARREKWPSFPFREKDWSRSNSLSKLKEATSPNVLLLFLRVVEFLKISVNWKYIHVHVSTSCFLKQVNPLIIYDSPHFCYNNIFQSAKTSLF